MAKKDLFKIADDKNAHPDDLLEVTKEAIESKPAFLKSLCKNPALPKEAVGMINDHFNQVHFKATENLQKSPVADAHEELVSHPNFTPEHAMSFLKATSLSAAGGTREKCHKLLGSTPESIAQHEFESMRKASIVADSGVKADYTYQGPAEHYLDVYNQSVNQRSEIKGRAYEKYALEGLRKTQHHTPETKAAYVQTLLKHNDAKVTFHALISRSDFSDTELQQFVPTYFGDAPDSKGVRYDKANLFRAPNWSGTALLSFINQDNEQDAQQVLLRHKNLPKSFIDRAFAENNNDIIPMLGRRADLTPEQYNKAVDRVLHTEESIGDGSTRLLQNEAIPEEIRGKIWNKYKDSMADLMIMAKYSNFLPQSSSEELISREYPIDEFPEPNFKSKLLEKWVQGHGYASLCPTHLLEKVYSEADKLQNTSLKRQIILEGKKEINDKVLADAAKDGTLAVWDVMHKLQPSENLCSEPVYAAAVNSLVETDKIDDENQLDYALRTGKLTPENKDKVENQMWESFTNHSQAATDNVCQLAAEGNEKLLSRLCDSNSAIAKSARLLVISQTDKPEVLERCYNSLGSVTADMAATTSYFRNPKCDVNKYYDLTDDTKQRLLTRIVTDTEALDHIGDFKRYSETILKEAEQFDVRDEYLSSLFTSTLKCTNLPLEAKIDLIKKVGTIPQIRDDFPQDVLNTLLKEKHMDYFTPTRLKEINLRQAEAIMSADPNKYSQLPSALQDHPLVFDAILKGHAEDGVKLDAARAYHRLTSTKYENADQFIAHLEKVRSHFKDPLFGAYSCTFSQVFQKFGNTQTHLTDDEQTKIADYLVDATIAKKPPLTDPDTKVELFYEGDEPVYSVTKDGTRSLDTTSKTPEEAVDKWHTKLLSHGNFSVLMIASDEKRAKLIERFPKQCLAAAHDLQKDFNLLKNQWSDTFPAKVCAMGTPEQINEYFSIHKDRLNEIDWNDFFRQGSSGSTQAFLSQLNKSPEFLNTVRSQIPEIMRNLSGTGNQEEQFRRTCVDIAATLGDTREAHSILTSAISRESLRHVTKAADILTKLPNAPLMTSIHHYLGQNTMAPTDMDIFEFLADGGDASKPMTMAEVMMDAQIKRLAGKTPEELRDLTADFLSHVSETMRSSAPHPDNFPKMLELAKALDAARGENVAEESVVDNFAYSIASRSGEKTTELFNKNKELLNSPFFTLDSVGGEVCSGSPLLALNAKEAFPIILRSGLDTRKKFLEKNIDSKDFTPDDFNQLLTTSSQGVQEGLIESAISSTKSDRFVPNVLRHILHNAPDMYMARGVFIPRKNTGAALKFIENNFDEILGSPNRYKFLSGVIQGFDDRVNDYGTIAHNVVDKVLDQMKKLSMPFGQDDYFHLANIAGDRWFDVAKTAAEMGNPSTCVGCAFRRDLDENIVNYYSQFPEHKDILIEAHSLPYSALDYFAPSTFKDQDEAEEIYPKVFAKIKDRKKYDKLAEWFDDMPSMSIHTILSYADHISGPLAEKVTERFDELFHQTRTDCFKHTEHKEFIHKFKSWVYSAPQDKEDEIYAILGHPSITMEDLEKCLRVETSGMIEKAANNIHITEDMFNWLYEKTKANYGESAILKLCQSPACPAHIAKDIYDKTSDGYPIQFERGSAIHPIFKNPRLGAKVFESTPKTIGPEFHSFVKPEALVPEFEYSKDAEDMKTVLNMPSDVVKWVDYKKQYPSQSQKPKIKALFQRFKDNVPKDAVVEEIRNHPKSKYHISYSRWSSNLQTHLNNTNLVVQLNATSSAMAQIAEDPRRYKFFQGIQRIATMGDGEHISGHPNTPFSIAWVRVDVSSNPNSWICEEFQSDWGNTLDKEIKKLKSSGREHFTIDDEDYSLEDMIKYNKQIAGVTENWVGAAYNGMEEMAKKQGVDLYIHGLGIRSEMSSRQTMTAERNGVQKTFYVPSSQFEEYYQELPKKRGYEEMSYHDLPNHNKTLSSKYNGYDLPPTIWKKSFRKA